MCVAIVKPCNIAPPKDEYLKASFENNPDGAGFSYSTGKKFITHKGLATYEDFNKKYKEVVKKLGDDGIKKCIMAFHFRIGTHGSKDDKRHTHPFPVSSKKEELEALDYSCRRIAMHNGIFSEFGQSKSCIKSEDGSAPMSDTMDFIASIVAPIQRILGDKTIFESKDAQSLIGREIGSSRFTIMEPDGRFLYWGTWVEEDKIFYSNSTYKPRTSVVYSKGWKNDKYWDDINYEGAYIPPVAPPKSDFMDDDLSKKTKDKLTIVKNDINEAGRRHALYPAYENQSFTTVDGARLEVTKKDASHIFINYLMKSLYVYDDKGGFCYICDFKDFHHEKTSCFI